MKYSYKNSGETIVEVLIATVLLVTVLASAFVSLNRAAKTNINVQNRVVAINLAREGMESVRNIRDTNWLKYSGNRRDKWLCFDLWTTDLDGVDETVSKCTGPSPSILDNGFYKTYFSRNLQRYFLIEVPIANELDVPGSSTGLEHFRLYQGSTGKLTYDSDNGGNPVTPFYRQIELTKNSVSACGTACNEGKMDSKLEVTVRVGWIEKNVSKNVTLETHLFDFYQRDEY